MIPFLALGVTASIGADAQVYCDMPTFSWPEPICHVTFAQIDNTVANDLTGPSALDFTDQVALVEAGQSYTITVTGNTSGSHVNSIRAYFDWNRDGIFDTAVLIGTIQASNCEGPISTSVTVPADAVPGTSRMRVMKKYLEGNPSPNDGCAAGSSFGQAQDYSVTVSGTTGIAQYEAPPVTVYPNPATTGSVFIRVARDLPGSRVEVRDLTGRLVHGSQVDLIAGQALPLAVGQLTPGQYFLAIIGKTGQWTERLAVR